LSCDDAGVALGPTSLVSVAVDASGRRTCDIVSAGVLERVLNLAYGEQAYETIERCHTGLRRVAGRLEAGDVGHAAVEAVLLRMPEVPEDGMAKLGGAGAILKTETAVWQTEPRVPNGQTGGGQWTSDGAGKPRPSAQAAPRAGSRGAKVDPTQARKATFMTTYLAPAIRAARSLNVPVQNVLGVAAYESLWGTSRFATEGHTPFGMYFPAPFATGPMPARGNAKAQLAHFKDLDDAFRSFAEKYKSGLSNVRDPLVCDDPTERIQVWD
jgi:hypothetical protein